MSMNQTIATNLQGALYRILKKILPAVEVYPIIADASSAVPYVVYRLLSGKDSDKDFGVSLTYDIRVIAMSASEMFALRATIMEAIMEGASSGSTLLDDELCDISYITVELGAEDYDNKFYVGSMTVEIVGCDKDIQDDAAGRENGEEEENNA